MKAKRKNNGTQKRRGRPATGRGVQVGTRWPNTTITTIDDWAAKQEDQPGRSEAMRRLVELGLTVNQRSSPGDGRRAARASELAGQAIDSMPSAGDIEQKAGRKRHLIKGPEEFRDVRVDKPRKK